MNEPAWIADDIVLAIHEVQLVEHGGREGIRDISLLKSALARPRNLFAHSTRVSLNRLASAYAVGIAKNHAFVDGNKRTGWVVCATFLELNGAAVISDPAEVVRMMLGVADGSIAEEHFEAWLDRDHQTTSLFQRKGWTSSTD